MTGREAKSAYVSAGMSYMVLVLRDLAERELGESTVLAAYEMRHPGEVRALISELQYWLDSGRIHWDSER